MHSFINCCVAAYATYVSVISGAFSRSFAAIPPTGLLARPRFARMVFIWSRVEEAFPDGAAGCEMGCETGCEAESEAVAWYELGAVVENVRAASAAWRLEVRRDDRLACSSEVAREQALHV